VLTNCGEYRQKDSQIVDTKRGSGFLRKLSMNLAGSDPVNTYYGTKAKHIALGVFGDTSQRNLT